MSRKARAHALAEHFRLVAQHVTQPVAALREHFREQPLDVAPVVVDAIEQQLDVGGERSIASPSMSTRARGAVIQLLRPLRDHERAARLRRDRELARQPEVERVDRLDAQAAGILGEAPAALRVARREPPSASSRSRAACGWFGIDFARAAPSARARASRRRPCA